MSAVAEEVPVLDAPAAKATAAARSHKQELVVTLDDALLARAMQESQQSAGSEGGESGAGVYERVAQLAGLSGSALAQALATTLDYRFIADAALADLEPDFALLAPAEATRRHCIVIHEEDQLTAVFADPFDMALRGWLEMKVAAPLEWALASREELGNLIARRAEALRAIDAVLPATQRDARREQRIDTLSYVSISEDASPVVRLVHSTVYDALRAGASDIHLESTAAGLVVRYRLDGVLVNIASIAGAELAEQVISRIKVMSELDIAERRVPQDGRFRMRIKGRKVDFRVSIIPSVYGEDAVIRILDKEQINDSFRDLRLEVVGFDPTLIGKFRRFILEPYGMVLVTGPTGSGKTTTLYAALNEIRNDEDKIITIEDPVEYQLRGITQIQVNEKKGLTFARGLRSILRHDPDKIMVGEIRDMETAQIAINSALTGHLVFTTVHANNVIDVIGRFINMGVEPYNFVSALNCVLAQRLVRMLCARCKERYQPEEAELIESGLAPARHRDREYFKSVGCEICNHTGYRGRTAIHELLEITDNIREMIIARKPGSEVRRAAQAEGLSSLRESALRLVFSGQTTLHEINRVTFVEQIN
ncbi:MAG: type II/IV secretion system protein [Sinobacteraceae bacterium]|nr:type II/IV secretion system protein [Nevskiaceae bacterium]